MKSTQERLSVSYCRPTTDDEWTTLLGYVPSPENTICGWAEDFGPIEHERPLEWMTEEIPVPHFTDLTQDRIASWRLEDDGFVFYASTGQHVLHTTGLKRYHVTLPPMSNTVKVDVWDGDKGIEADNVTTYTDLLTLIHLVG